MRLELSFDTDGHSNLKRLLRFGSKSKFLICCMRSHGACMHATLHGCQYLGAFYPNLPNMWIRLPRLPCMDDDSRRARVTALGAFLWTPTGGRGWPCGLARNGSAAAIAGFIPSFLVASLRGRSPPASRRPSTSTAFRRELRILPRPIAEA